MVTAQRETADGYIEYLVGDVMGHSFERESFDLDIPMSVSQHAGPQRITS